MNRSERKRRKLEAEHVERTLVNKVICDQCGCTLETFGAKCVADLAEWCPGFLTIELCYYPDARNVPPNLNPALVTRAREIIAATPLTTDDSPLTAERSEAP